MRIKVILFYVCFILYCGIAYADKDRRSWYIYDYVNDYNFMEENTAMHNVLPWVLEKARENNMEEKYGIQLGKNPFYMVGDFDGGGRSDVIMWIYERETKKVGVAMFFREQKQVAIFGAGNGDSNYDNLWGADKWVVYPKEQLPKYSHWDYFPGIENIKGDIFEYGYWGKSDFALYWNGKEILVYVISS